MGIKIPIELIDRKIAEVGARLAGFDTSEYVKYKYGIQFYENQVEVFDTITNPFNHFTVVIAARGGGKTFSVALSVHHLCSEIPNLKVGIFAPKFAQSKRVTEQIYNLDKSHIDRKSSSKVHIVFKNGSEIWSDSAHEQANIEGSHYHIIVIDESLHGETLVSCQYRKYAIKDIVKNKKDVKVWTFNLETQQRELSEIINYFEHECYRDCVEVEYEANGRKEVLRCTEDHLIYTTNRGYVKAKDLTENDELLIDKKLSKKREFKCNFCGTNYSSYKEHKCCSSKDCRKKYFETKRSKNFENKKSNICPNCGKKCVSKYCDKNCYFEHMTEKKCVCGKKFKRKGIYCSDECRILDDTAHSFMKSTRMKQNNPCKRNDVRQKIGKSIKNKIANMSEDEKKIFLNNWRNAPLHNGNKITRPEKVVIDMKINGLKYTGNGDFWVTFKNGRHKNPDFVKNRHIVEVGDFHYWHNEKEKNDIVNLYAEIGYKCLYLSSDEVYDNINTKSTIEEFLVS